MKVKDNDGDIWTGRVDGTWEYVCDCGCGAEMILSDRAKLERIFGPLEEVEG